jgi:hypothetical protein
MSVSVKDARAWGKRDGQRAVELARETEDDDELAVIETVSLSARVMGWPDPGRPGSVARRLCSDWDDTTEEGIYVGPEDLPIAGRISSEAAKAAKSGGPAWDGYWDALELELRRANVALLVTYFDHPYEHTHIRSLYVVDNDRFPIWNGKELVGFAEDGSNLIEEICVQEAYLPVKKGIGERLCQLFQRRGS